MDDKFKTRILLFYFAGFLNLMLGLYVLFNGRAIVDHRTWLILLALFFGFTIVNFWFARTLRQKWIEAYHQYLAQQQAAQGKAEGEKRKAEGA